VKWTASCIILALLVAPAPASAGPSGEWLSLEGGFSSYAMDDVNGQIGSLNLIIEPHHLDEINNGFSLGISGGIRFSDSRFGIGYQRLYASSQADQGNGEYHIPANTFRAIAEFYRTTASRLEYGVGIGAGVISLDGQVRPTLTGPGHLEGSTFLADVRVLGGLPVGSWLVVAPSAGYRFADIPDVELDGNKVNSFGHFLHADYSGFFAQLGFRVNLGH
jgi:hypothetical protein